MTAYADTVRRPNGGPFNELTKSYWLSALLIAGFALEAAVFGVNENRVLERYMLYGVPLVLAACVWSFDVRRPDARRYRLLA